MRFLNYENLELEDRLSVIFLLTGGLMSFFAFVLGMIFGSPLWMNTPHILICMLCIVIPIFFKKDLSKITVIMLFIVAFLYFPFVYFTNAGNEGSAPFYFVMILVYFSFYLRGRSFVIFISTLMIFYLLLMMFGNTGTQFVVPYPDMGSRFIDLCVAVSLVSFVMATVAYTAFTGYRQEKRIAYDLMLELEKRNKELEFLSVHDPLTEVFTRRYFFDRLQNELDNASDTEENFHVLMIDLDFFKRVNDEYGHLYGDDVLRSVACEIRNNIRDYDVLARYGGEEFVVLVGHSPGEVGYEVAENIRINVGNIKYKHNKPVTVSIGVAINNSEDSVESIIQRADEKLYEAKKNGRNRVMI